MAYQFPSKKRSDLKNSNGKSTDQTAEEDLEQIEIGGS